MLVYEMTPPPGRTDESLFAIWLGNEALELLSSAGYSWHAKVSRTIFSPRSFFSLAIGS
jgi:hypothetical protein